MPLSAKAWKELEMQLLALRPLLLTESDRSSLKFFDELLEQREYGLALDTVCDFLLESNSLPVSQSVLDKIQRLEAAMQIDESRLEELRSKKVV